MCCYKNSARMEVTVYVLLVKLCKDESNGVCVASQLCKDGSNSVCVAIVNSARMEVTVYVLL